MNFLVARSRANWWFLGCVITVWAAAAQADEVEVKLKDGRILSGAKGVTSGLTEIPRPVGMGVLQRILFVDDQMRRTFVSKRLYQEERYPKRGAPLRPFEVYQGAKRAGREVVSVGAILRIEPFDQHGRRIVTVQAQPEPVDIVQGITELTPDWAKVETITPFVWEMHIPTNSLSPKVLESLLNRQPNAGKIAHQKKVARFYIAMERYEAAAKVLETLLKEHADDAELRKSVEPSLRQVRQLSAQRLVNELKRRRDQGQHALVFAALEKFPSEDVAGEILQEVSELIAQYRNQHAQGERIVNTIKDLTAKVEDAQMRARIEPVAKEIEVELNFITLDRMAAFRLAMDDADMAPTERLALAISGWLLGSNASTANLPNALSAYTVRNLIREYLVESSETKRAALLEEFNSQEAAAPTTVARLLEHMRPPLASEPVEGKPGYYELEVPGPGDSPPIRYVVQTPPEYDPYRQYPTILTLHAEKATPEQQLDWWAGSWNKKGHRMGQAGRQGYIVVAPQWTDGSQRQYEYSAREHAAVLYCLRDVCRRFSVDTDRVYLTGHSAGGEAAWDIGLAHPDLWAGVMPIVAKAHRFCRHYWRNAEYVPFYFVGGEKDGRWLADNATEMDRYLNGGFNATVVEYLGRGRENYSDEIFRLFDWMGRCKRNFYPREFACDSLRPWDNFFWWVEIEGFPERSVVDPRHWSTRGKRPLNTSGKLTPGNGILVRTGASRVTVWISPKMVNFEEKVKITVHGKEVNRGEPYVKPDLATMLEDARTRADRLHPFWAKVVSESGRTQRGR